MPPESTYNNPDRIVINTVLAWKPLHIAACPMRRHTGTTLSRRTRLHILRENTIQNRKTQR